MAFLRSHPDSPWASHNSRYRFSLSDSHWESLGIAREDGDDVQIVLHLSCPFDPISAIGRAALRWWVAAALWVVAVVVLMQTACRDENMP